MDKRITELEIRLTHMEITVEVLDRMIIAQQAEIDAHKLKIEILEKKLRAAAQSQVAHEKDETPPPHY